MAPHRLYYNPDEATVKQRYLEDTQAYDGWAGGFKFSHALVTTGLNLIPYVTLAVAILGPLTGLSEGHGAIILPSLFLALTVLSILGALLQFFADLRKRWLSYRAATHSLWKQCMLYRARIKPYAENEAWKLLNNELDKQQRDTGQVTPNPYDRNPGFFRLFLTLFRAPPPVPPQGDRHLPCHEGMDPPLVDLQTGTVSHDRAMQYLNERLRSQQRWHVVKARHAFKWWCITTGVIGSISVGAALYVKYQEQPVLWLTALSTVVTLGVFAWQQSMGYGRLWLAYAKVARNLEAIAWDYEHGMGQFPVNNPKHPLTPLQRFQLLVELTENILDVEFERWRASRP